MSFVTDKLGYVQLAELVRFRGAAPVGLAKAIWREATMAASRLEPHSRFAVMAGTDVGRSTSGPAIRATLRLSSSAPFALPGHDLSTRPAPMRAPGRPASATSAPPDHGTPSARAPPYFPKGVHTASYRYTSVGIGSAFLPSCRGHDRGLGAHGSAAGARTMTKRSPRVTTRDLPGPGRLGLGCPSAGA
jgi:hypothetical protein